MMPRKISHIASNVNNSLMLEAIPKSLDPAKYEFSCIFLNPERPEIADRLQSMGYESAWLRYRGKKDLPRVMYELRKLFRNLEVEVVHTHLVEASIAGLTAAALAGIKIRVHTRHHGSECHNYHPHAVYYDRYNNFLSKRIVAITESVRRILVEKEGVSSDKVSVINHGYDLSSIVANEDAVNRMRTRYGLNSAHPIVGVISRFVELKGIQYIIPAFKQLTKIYPHAKLVLANASGSYASEINRLLCQNLDAEQFVCIDFEPQIFDLYKTFDVFVHVPVGADSEAFGQTYIEPLLLGVPSVFTLSGVANDFIADEVNALVVPYKDPGAIYAAMRRVLTEPQLVRKITDQGREDARMRFGLDTLGERYDRLYSSLLD